MQFGVIGIVCENVYRSIQYLHKKYPQQLKHFKSDVTSHGIAPNIFMYKEKNAYANMLIYPGKEVCRGDDIIIQRGGGILLRYSRGEIKTKTKKYLL